MVWTKGVTHNWPKVTKDDDSWNWEEGKCSVHRATNQFPASKTRFSIGKLHNLKRLRTCFL
jgi:hypothetical protein